jgi:hypothetical protein
MSRNYDRISAFLAATKHKGSALHLHYDWEEGEYVASIHDAQGNVMEADPAEAEPYLLVGRASIAIEGALDSLNATVGYATAHDHV